MTDQSVVFQFQSVLAQINSASKKASRDADEVQLVAVSKTYFADKIEPILAAGHRVFGENRVQETAQKWPALREAYNDIELHLIGPLQSNKAAEAVALYDVIESIDRKKIADALASEMDKQEKALEVYIQVNTGIEEQKAGIEPNDVAAFVIYCRDEKKLNVTGLMCIPPAEENPGPHFALLRKLASENGLEKLSMGMSGDYQTAIAFGATSVRVGSAIFGERN